MEILKKDYEVICELGKGQFGVAYKVCHLATSNIYCAKVVNMERFPEKVK